MGFDSFGSRYVYYATMFLGFIILLAAFTGINYFYQSPIPPVASMNIQYNMPSYNITVSLQDLITFAKAQNFTPLSNLNNDNFIPILNESENGENVTNAIKEILSMNASEIAPIPYWEAEDLAQFLNVSFMGYEILHSYAIPLSPSENESWTLNYLSFNITKFNVTIHNYSYTPSTNVIYSLSIINETIPQIIWVSSPGPNGTIIYKEIKNCIQSSTIILQVNGYTYNGTVPMTWLQNNTEYHLLRQGDGPYTFSLKYVMWGNNPQPYSEFVKIFTNDTLVMKMRYGNITVNRNYTGLIGWINATPEVVPNQFGGHNYILKFSLNIQTYPVPDYVTHHPPPSSVFNNNYAFEYLEWNEYRLLAENIYNFTIQFTNNVTQHLNYNYTEFWRDEAYGIVTEMLAHDLHNNVSSKYQHQYPIQALWDGNGTQYEANENLALILENLMPVNITIGQHYNITSFYPVYGEWVPNWSYVYVNVQCLPQYWANNTVFLQYNYTYLTDIGSTNKYFSDWQIPNGTYNNVTLYSPLPTSIVFHYGTYYLNITPIEFYNITSTLGLIYNDTAEYKIF
jgi:hypothetical protein